MNHTQSVSYTHLDVYKRQDLNRARLPIPPLLHFAPVITGDESYYKGIWGICQLLLLRK